MLAFDTRHRRTRVCLSVAGRIGAGRGHFKVLGGTGAARRLHAAGALSRRSRAQKVHAQTGAPRGLPKACRALRRSVPKR